MSDPNKHIDWKKILAYLRRGKRGKAAHEIEKEAEKDPFLRDAIEGFESVESDEEVSKHISEIEDYVNYRRSQIKGSKTLNRRMISIAASLTVLISASVWVWFSIFQDESKSELADKMKENEVVAEEVLPEKVISDLERQVESEPEKEGDEMSKEAPLVSENDPIQIEKKENTDNEDLIAEEKSLDDLSGKGSEYSSTSTSAFSKLNMDSLLIEILETEKDFWLMKDENHLVLNEVKEPIAAENAGGAMEEELMMDDAPKKRKESRSAARESAPAAAMQKSIAAKPEDKEEMDTLEYIQNLDYSSLEKEILLDSANNEFFVLYALSLLKRGDTSRAKEYFEKARAKSAKQEELIKSLLKNL